MSGTPTAPTSTASTNTAAAAPSSAERQPRLTPAATTIVSASTISTALAPKTATIRIQVEELCISADSVPATDARGAQRRTGTPSIGPREAVAMGDATTIEQPGRNYIVVSADTHASPDSLDHFLSYVDPAHREAVAAFGDMSALAISMFGGFDPGEIDDADPVRATAARRLAGMGVDTDAAQSWLSHYGTDWVIPGDGDGRRLQVLEAQAIHAEVTLPGPILAGGLSPAMYLGAQTDKGLEVVWPALH